MPPGSGDVDNSRIKSERQILLQADPQVRFALRLLEMREDAHFRAILRSGAYLHGTAQVELRIARITVVDRSEQRDDPRPNLRAERRLLRWCKGTVLLRTLGLGGDLEIWLAPVPPGCKGRVRYKAEPHAAFLVLLGDDWRGEDDLAGQRKFAEEGASEDRNPLERAWWPRLVICVGGGDRCAAQPVDNRVE